jgi:outer membrane receptor protein involved in Fe transport
MQATFSRSALYLALAVIGPGFAPAYGADTAADGKKPLALEEVIVTATRREETLNNVAVSVSALNGEETAALGQRTLESAVASIPNVGFTTSSSGNNLTIRGVGSPALDNVQSSVATFIDGVYITRSRNASAPLYDVQRVEVLRGPQGALFGKNSIAGVFNIVTQKPTQQFEGLVDVRGGNYDSHEGTLVLSGGLADTLSARFAAFNRKTGDYLENDLDADDAGGTRTEAYRLSFAWTPSDNTDVGLKYEHFRSRLDNAIYQMISLDPADRARLTQSLGAAVVNRLDTKLDRHMAAGLASYTGIDLGASPEFYSKTGTTFVTLSLNHTFDNDYEFSATLGDTHSDFSNKYASSDYPVVGVYQNSNVYSTSDNLELRLSSPVQDRFRFTVGAYADRSRDITDHGYSQANFETYGAVLNGALAGSGVPSMLLLTPAQLAPGMQVIIPGDNSNPSYSTSYALYGEATYEFTEQWSATIGLRGALDKRTLKQDYSSRTDLNGNPLGSAQAVAALVPAGPLAATQTGIYTAALPGLLGRIAQLPGSAPYQESRMDKALLPAGKIEFRPNVDTLVYFSAQTGYKNGGFNTATFGRPNTFDKEKSLAFELGGKFAVADGRGQINAALFQTKFDDLQVAALDPVTGAVGFTNAAKATSRGVEIDGNWRLTETVSVGASYAYLDATYDSFKGSACNIDNTIAAGPAGASSCTQDLSDSRLQRAPLNSASVFASYVQPLAGAFELQANISANYRGSYFTDVPDSEQLRAAETTVVDARVALVNTVDKWTVAAIANNLTNNQDMVGGQASSSLTQSARTYFGQMRPPATYWLEIEKRF